MLSSQFQLAAIVGRQFAECVTALLMLKFVSGFNFLEGTLYTHHASKLPLTVLSIADITLSGDFGEPLSLATRIHVHLQDVNVPPSVLNALEELRILGNRELFMYVSAAPLDGDSTAKVRASRHFLATVSSD